MFSPIFIINALEDGERMELFTRKKNKKGELTDTIETIVPITYGSLSRETFGQDNVRVQEELVKAVASANADQNDIEEGTLMAWCRGLKPCEIEIALHYLVKENLFATYELADPGDKKSVYKFYTLAVNKDHQWGTKQFKKGKKS
jgi:hypothetical protein